MVGDAMTIDDLLAALRTARLVTPEGEAHARAVSAARFGDRVDRSSAAYLLDAIDQPIPGYISHDFHFWDETADVVAEFAAAIAGSPLALELLTMDGTEQRMRVRITVAGDVRRRWFPVDGSVGGLDLFASYLNKLLADVGAVVRVYALETDELDWHAFVIRTPAEVEALRAAGWVRRMRA